MHHPGPGPKPTEAEFLEVGPGICISYKLPQHELELRSSACGHHSLPSL